MRTKRLLAMLLTLTMIVSGVPSAAIAAETNLPEQSEEQQYNEVEAQGSVGDGEAAEVTEVPAETTEETVPEEGPVSGETAPAEEAASVEEAVPAEETAPTEEAVPAEETAPEEEAQPMTFEGRANGVTVTVEAPAGAFEEGTEMTVKKASAQAVIDAINDTEDIDIEVKSVKAVDITFTDANGEAQPKLPINVKLTSDLVAETEAPVIVHVDDEGVAETIEEVKAVKGEEDAIEFEAEHFSVYAIVEGDDLKQPRTTYHFLNELKSDGTAEPFTFVDKAGQTVDYQIVKNDELLTDPGSPVVGLEKNFLGWFIATKNGDTYTITDEKIDFSSPHPKTATVATGDLDVYVAPRYGQAFIVTFWDNAKGSDPANMHIVAKRLVFLDEGKTYASVRVDNVNVPTASTQVLSAWTSDNYKTGEQVTYTLKEKPEWDEVSASFDLYPIFSDGHWLRFSGGPAGSGAGYRQAIFVTANTQADDLSSLGKVGREGYTFKCWSYDEEGTDPATDGNGDALNAADLLTRVQNAAGDTTLHGQWEGDPVGYKIATWFENANDDNYTYGSLSDGSGTAGTLTNATAAPVDGFIAEPIEQQTIKGDGTTIVNIYYKRAVYEIKFYRATVRSGWNSYTVTAGSQYTDLTITAKFEQDIHTEWPSFKGYGSAWYVATGTNPAWVLMVPTMPQGGGSFYEYSSSGNNLVQKFMIQHTDGSNNFDQMYETRYQGNTSITTSADDYIHIEGFRVNAQSQNDANRIRSNPSGDPEAVSDRNYNRSISIGTSYSQGAREGSDYVLYYYYLRNQYDVTFNTLKSGAATPAALTGIYYQANIANTKASEIAALNTQYKPGETTVEVTGEGTYVFQGWYDNADGMGDPFNFDQAMPAGNITLYAKWSRVYYLIQIDPRGGEILPNVNEVTYTWLQYGNKIEQYNIRRDYVEAASDYTGTKYYYVSVLASDDPNARETTGYYPSTYRKGFYIPTTDINNDEYAWWKEKGYIDTSKEYMPATTNDNYAFVGWYNAADNKVYDFDAIVTGETSIYARWRRSGLFNLKYDAQNIEETVTGVIGSEVIMLDTSYADQASTNIAYKPDKITSTDGKTYVFLGWKVKNPNTGELMGDLYEQGDDFTVDANLADSGHNINLVAVYEPAENNPDTMPVTTLTFDPNFPSGATDTSGSKTTFKDIPLNTEIDLGAGSFTITLADEVRTETIPVFSAGGYVQTGWNTQPDESGEAFSLEAVVGVDNLEKTNNGLPNTLYAIWQGVFYVYHSGVAGGNVETINITSDDMKYDLTQNLTDNTLYGGYYLEGGFTKPAGDPTPAYDGTNWTWTTAQTESGDNITPTAGTTYYIKEVPEYYLLPYMHYSYTKADNSLKALILISAVDDLKYNETGYVLQNDNQTARVSSTIKVTNAVGGKTVTLKASTVFRKQGIKSGGYLTSWNATESDDYFAKNKVFTMTPYWITMDGIEVTGKVTRTIYTGDLTYGTDTGIRKEDN